MTQQIHIMLDLETWGTTPGSDIRSIGACVFAPHTRHGGSLVHDGSLGTIKPFYIACDNPPAHGGAGYHYDDTIQDYRRYNLSRDPKTVQWWSEQSEKARGAFTDPVDLREALKRFDIWLTDIAPRTTPDRQSPDIRLWAHGPSFDVSILDAAYRAVNLPVPWHYRAPRDTRTAFDMANVGDHSQWLQQFNQGTAHNALDDAISQARAVCAAYERLRDNMRKSFEDGYTTCREDEYNDGTPYPRWGVNDGFRRFMNERLDASTPPV